MTADFTPMRFIKDPHAQTILGVLLNYWQPSLPSRCRSVRLVDGDRLLMYDSLPRCWDAGDPVALLVHGLSGCHRSGYLARLGRLLRRDGIRVVRLDLRGAGLGIRYARRTYNAGSSDDVRAAAEEVSHWCPDSPLVLVGYSLGGNIVLKLVGETDARPLPALAAVAAINPPVDLEACSAMLSRPSNRFYNRYFASALVRQVLQHRRYFPDLPAVEFPSDLTLRQFDDLYTAPRGGFTDSADYYRRASSVSLLERITLPTLIFTARDDPFVAVEPLAELHPRPGLEVRIAGFGGHLGYVGWNGDHRIHWAEPQVADWIMRTLQALKKTPAAIG
jgi:predicted alpha/beta-fold hydrolase